MPPIHDPRAIKRLTKRLNAGERSEAWKEASELVAKRGVDDKQFADALFDADEEQLKKHEAVIAKGTDPGDLAPSEPGDHKNPWAIEHRTKKMLQATAHSKTWERGLEILGRIENMTWQPDIDWDKKLYTEGLAKSLKGSPKAARVYATSLAKRLTEANREVLSKSLEHLFGPEERESTDYVRTKKVAPAEYYIDVLHELSILARQGHLRENEIQKLQPIANVVDGFFKDMMQGNYHALYSDTEIRGVDAGTVTQTSNKHRSKIDSILENFRKGLEKIQTE